MGAKGKLDLSKQSKAQNYLNGWAETSKRLRTTAIIIVVCVVGFTILLSFVTPYKYFPKHPTNTQIQEARLRVALQKFHKPPLK